MKSVQDAIIVTTPWLIVYTSAAAELIFADVFFHIGNTFMWDKTKERGPPNKPEVLSDIISANIYQWYPW